MIDIKPISNKQIIDCLSSNYGIEVTTLTFLPLGADMNASVYKAEVRNQSSYFVKLKRGHGHDISTFIISLLHDAGIQQVILPITTKSGHATQQLDNFTLIVYPFVEGRDGFCSDLADDQWVMLGKVMRQVHEINLPSHVQLMIRREEYSPKWREAVRSLYVHIESEPSGDEIALKLVAFIRKHMASIHRLVDQAEQLSKKIKDQSHKFVLCHSDIHGGNVLIDGKDTFYIVDWDEPMMAPKERDLMFIGGGVANVWNKSHEEALFYKGYGETEINMSLLAYYRHERIVEDIAQMCQQLLLTTVGGHDRLESYKHFVDQFEPQGVVEIAFKTSEKI